MERRLLLGEVRNGIFRGDGGVLRIRLFDGTAGPLGVGDPDGVTRGVRTDDRCVRGGEVGGEAGVDAPLGVGGSDFVVKSCICKNETELFCESPAREEKFGGVVEGVAGNELEE